MATIGEQIRAARKAKGMTQDDLAALMNISRAGVSHWETDKTMPDAQTLLRLSKVLGYSFESGSAIEDAPAVSPDGASGNGQSDSPNSAPVNSQNNPQDSAPANGQSDPQVAAKPAPKRRPLKVALALALAAIALGCALGLWLGRGKPSTYQSAAKLADEAGQLTMEFFQTPVQQVGGLPYLAYSYDTSVEMDNGGSAWFYDFHFRETNGYAFKINRAVVYSFPPGAPFTDSFSPEQLSGFGIATEIPAHGEWSLSGGFPVQPYQGVAIILYGEDEHGTEMEFHGYIDYNASLPGDRQD